MSDRIRPEAKMIIRVLKLVFANKKYSLIALLSAIRVTLIFRLFKWFDAKSVFFSNEDDSPSPF